MSVSVNCFIFGSFCFQIYFRKSSRSFSTTTNPPWLPTLNQQTSSYLTLGLELALKVPNEHIHLWLYKPVWHWSILTAFWCQLKWKIKLSCLLLAKNNQQYYPSHFLIDTHLNAGSDRWHGQLESERNFSLSQIFIIHWFIFQFLRQRNRWLSWSTKTSWTIIRLN